MLGTQLFVEVRNAQVELPFPIQGQHLTYELQGNLLGGWLLSEPVKEPILASLRWAMFPSAHLPIRVAAKKSKKS